MKRTMIVWMVCAGALTGPALGADPVALAGTKQCFICHDGQSEVRSMIGPPFRDIARRYKTVGNAKTMLAEVIQSGTEGHWAASKMPAASARVPVSKEEAEVLAEYVLSLE
jgi:cytochrome c